MLQYSTVLYCTALYCALLCYTVPFAELLEEAGEFALAGHGHYAAVLKVALEGELEDAEVGKLLRPRHLAHALHRLAVQAGTRAAPDWPIASRVSGLPSRLAPV
eukprot:470597-Prorocentrum_minimum.AAC.1